MRETVDRMVAMEIENVTLVLTNKSIYGISISPHGVVGVTGVVRGCLILRSADVLITFAPLAHSDSLLHYILIPSEIRVRQAEMSVYGRHHFARGAEYLLALLIIVIGVIPLRPQPKWKEPDVAL